MTCRYVQLTERHVENHWAISMFICNLSVGFTSQSYFGGTDLYIIIWSVFKRSFQKQDSLTEHEHLKVTTNHTLRSLVGTRVTWLVIVDTRTLLHRSVTRWTTVTWPLWKPRELSWRSPARLRNWSIVVSSSLVVVIIIVVVMIIIIVIAGLLIVL